MNTTPSSDDVQNQAQERANLQAVQTVGMPTIRNFWEKRQLKAIFEKRDDAFPTIAYVSDWQGHFHKFCNSVGYGIPSAVQYTNPQKTELHYGTSEGGNVVIAQADPNGLYSPSSADATWVMCLDKNKNMQAVYVEDRVEVFPVAVVPQNLAK